MTPKSPLTRPPGSHPDWVAANPARIAAVAARAAARPTGGWVVAGATPPPGSERARRVTIAGADYVLWRGVSGPLVAPDVCPHMGASLGNGGAVAGGCLVCPWHGLHLGPDGHGWWHPLPTYDDGALTWVRLDSGVRSSAPGLGVWGFMGGRRPTGTPNQKGSRPAVTAATLGGATQSDGLTGAPIVPKRPDRALHGVVELEGRCEVRDVIENRLDPWHGRHYHPFAFADLIVVDEDDEGMTCDVDYRIAGPIVVRVRARFDAPEAATVRMSILDGIGAGSVVETHAVAVGERRTRVVEAFFATAQRLDLSTAKLGTGMSWFLARTARRLWVDDLAYAERRSAVRHGEVAGWRGSCT